MMKTNINKAISTVALFFLATLLLPIGARAQDELLDLVNSEIDAQKIIDYTHATFKGSRIINGHSVETRKKGELEFLISHRFGRLNSGAYEFFGLDGANVRLGLEYGLTKHLNVGIGRNSFEKTFDGFLKYKLLRQSSGARTVPVSLVWFSSTAIKTLKNTLPEINDDFNYKLAYTHQLLLARKFSEKLSLQVMPTYVHKNLVEFDQENYFYAIGIGGRAKLTQRLSINAEYYYQLEREDSQENYNSLAIGLDIETGGHVFQLHVTNSRAMNEKGFITETTGDFFEGDIHFGFNISRVF